MHLLSIFGIIDHLEIVLQVQIVGDGGEIDNIAVVIIVLVYYQDLCYVGDEETNSNHDPQKERKVHSVMEYI